MKILLILVLAASAIGWAVLGANPMQQIASASDMPRQISQISR